MNFQFSEDAEALRTQARKFLAEQSDRSRARSVMDAGTHMDKALWQQMVDLGWTALRIPDVYGGLGLGVLELCVLAEEVGRALTPVPFTSSVLMATELLIASGHADMQKTWLPKLANGSAIGTVAWMEGTTGSPVSAPNLSFERGGLIGTKIPVADGMIADFAIVTATDALTGELIIAVQELSHDKVTRENTETIDLVRPHATISFDGCNPAILAQGAQAEKLRDHFIHATAVLLAFEGLGGAEAAMDMAVAYAKDRVTFGRKIGSYQAVKHKCADMYIKNQLARSHAYYGAWALSTDAPELAQAASGARLAAMDAYRYAAEENVQLHGGIGFTWESDCQFFYRRARLLALSLGARPFWVDRLVRTLEQRNTLAA